MLKEPPWDRLPFALTRDDCRGFVNPPDVAGTLKSMRGEGEEPVVWIEIACIDAFAHATGEEWDLSWIEMAAGTLRWVRAGARTGEGPSLEEWQGLLEYRFKGSPRVRMCLLRCPENVYLVHMPRS
jgi:hypothetical protein